MVDVTLSSLLSTAPVTEDVTGDEPIESVVATQSRAFTLKQLSATPINAQTGTSYTLALTDQGHVVTMSNSASNTITIPNNTNVAFNLYSTIIARWIGVGALTIVGESGVTIQKKASSSFVLSEQFSQVVFHKTAINTWHLAGELAPV